MPKARLFLVRHGETDDNQNGVFQGQAGRGLNARGRSQAEKLALRLAELEPGVDLHALYSSDLERAVQTASILADVLGLTVRLDEGLREVDVGSWQGKTLREIEELYPEEYAAWRAGMDVRRGAGETYAELRDRLSEALDRIVALHQGGHVIVVSHGAAIKSYVAGLFGPVMSNMRHLGVISNASVTIVERERDGTSRLAVLNDVAHLRDPVTTAARTLPDLPLPSPSSGKSLRP